MQIDDSHSARIDAAIAAAECGTDGEIMVIASDASDAYHDVALHWSLAAALLALALLASFPALYTGIVDWMAGGWVHEWTVREYLSLALFMAAGKFIGVWLILSWRPLRLALTPRATRRRRVRRRAILLFKASTERRTATRTGVLLYISQAERMAEIVVDEAIHARVPNEGWGEAMTALISELREGRPAEGVVAAVGAIGAILAEALPRTGTDPNELPDRLVRL